MAARKPDSGSSVPPISILYQDKQLVAVDKPAGLLVIPSPKGETQTLGSLVNGFLQADSAISGDGQAWPCHRIDRETSGIMLYARGKSMQQEVMALFQKRLVHKSYLAIVNGIPGKAKGTINLPIEGQESITEYEVIGAGSDFAVVLVKPLTGRTNQIRIHFARMGHPLVGDAKFGIRKQFARSCKRCALHAWRLELRHPATGQLLRIEAPIPADLAGLLAEAGLASN